MNTLHKASQRQVIAQTGENESSPESMRRRPKEPEPVLGVAGNAYSRETKPASFHRTGFLLRT